MTRPIQVPSPTRRISESMAAIRQLQRRPAPTADGSSGLSWVRAGGAELAGAVVLSYRSEFDEAYTNDTAAFEITSDKEWLQINTSGYYVAKFALFKRSGGMWVNTDDTWVQPLVDLGGVPSPLQDNLGVPDWIGDWFSARSQFKAGDETNLSLAAECTFNWNPDSPVSDLDFENPLKISCQMVAPDEGATVNLGVDVFVMRIADAGYTDISPV